MKRLLLLACLAGCHSAPSGAPPRDETLSRLGEAGNIAYTLEEPAQAAQQYRAALDRARQRDDTAAIDDTGFNLATAELRANRPRTAIVTAHAMREELARRGAVDPALDLITATALYRLGDLASADRMAATLTAARTPALADAAWFLRGLIADAKGDRAMVRQAAAALSPTAEAADKAELQARIARDPAVALRAADLRRTALDYRGMARALAVAADCTSDPRVAAELYLRAGQSAAEQHDFGQARVWLAEARARAPDHALRTEADRLLHGLKAR